jgi:hypothetical protein
MRRIAVLCLIAIAMLVCGGLSAHRWYFPYGQSHCCNKGLYFALMNYADRHDGRFPAGEATAEASLSRLYPDFADANLLRGKTVPLETVESILASGRLLDPDSCGWHYVAGLTKRDDGRIALFWDKVGLGHNGGRLDYGGHSVFYLNCDHGVVTAAEWPRFLEEQAKLLASRDEQAIKGQPALIATIRLPSGKTVDHFAGNWQLETKERSENSSGEGQQSGPELSPSVLRWYHLPDGEITYVLRLVDEGWFSKPVTVRTRNGKTEPGSIIFEMGPR